MDKLHNESAESNVLPESVPVTMPELPAQLTLTSIEQIKAIADRVRERILGIIQQQPATAKQIADRLHMAPGTIGHHLQVLEAAGLAKVVARRLIRGIVAKYYTRTARIFIYDLVPEVAGDASLNLDVLTHARNELAESVAAGEENVGVRGCGFPHARISAERVKFYEERLNALVDDLVNEPSDPEGQVYGLIVALFKSPPYMQVSNEPAAPLADEES